MTTIKVRQLVIISFVLLLFVGIFGTASNAAVKLTVEKKGTYIYWLEYKNGAGEVVLTEPQRFKGKNADVDVSELGTVIKTAKIYVMNKKNGNMAIADYALQKDPKAAKPIELSKDDFEYVRTVKLRVVTEDKAPLERGIVNITDGEGTEMSTVVTPADAGIATFRDVAAGEINVKVRAEGIKKTVNSDIELSLDRKTPDFEKDIKITGDVDTLPVVADTDNVSRSKAPAEEDSKGGGVPVLLSFLSGLIFLAIVVAVVFVVLRSKGVTAKGALQQMGVVTEEQPANGSIPAAPAAPAVDPTICEFCGQKKDAAGNCACSVAPGSSPFGAPAASASSGPRLIGMQGVYSGHIFDITGGSAVIGREAGNDVALPNDTTSSRRHAIIAAENGGFVIRDQGSSNGTYVNGAKITEQKLTPGDEVQVGGTKFRFEA